MSCGPGVSAAIASCTASLTSAGFIPTSSGFLCCQSKRSGKYGARRLRLRAAARWNVGETIAILRQRRSDDERRRERAEVRVAA